LDYLEAVYICEALLVIDEIVEKFQIRQQEIAVHKQAVKDIIKKQQHGS